MLYVSLILEVLRARPALVFWTAALAQVVVWTLVPALFYQAPPGELATILAIGHEFQIGTTFGPPLAFWAAEIAYIAFGMFGVYLLAQLCVLVAYWALFQLGIAIVGARHAGLAILLMIGIAAFTVPSPEFGPGIAAMPFWALTLLWYWRAVGEERTDAWFFLAFSSAFLLLASAAGAILIALLIVFTLATPRGRAAIAALDPWLAIIVALVVVFPYAFWAIAFGDAAQPSLQRLRLPMSLAIDGMEWLRLVGLVVATHAGFVVLILLAAGFPLSFRRPAVAIERQPVDAFARMFVYVFALVPALVATILALLLQRTFPLGGLAPLVLLSGLAVIVAAGDSIRPHYQRVSAYAWFALLAVPPAMTVVATGVLPWIGNDLRVAQPADAIAQYFADAFRQRTGAPLAIVTGDQRLASLVALRAPERPALIPDVPRARAPWANADLVKSKGALVLWRTTEIRGAPPAEISEKFPGLEPEVSRVFERVVQGRLTPLRIGWAVIPPQKQASRN